MTTAIDLFAGLGGWSAPQASRLSGQQTTAPRQCKRPITTGEPATDHAHGRQRGTTAGRPASHRGFDEGRLSSDAARQVSEL